MGHVLAARIPGHVGRDTKRERSRRLHDLGARMKADHMAKFRGTERPILWEGDPSEAGDGGLRWQGYTDNYLRVSTTTSGSIDLENTIETVRLSGIEDEVFRADRVTRAAWTRASTALQHSSRDSFATD